MYHQISYSNYLLGTLNQKIATRDLQEAFSSIVNELIHNPEKGSVIQDCRKVLGDPGKESLYLSDSNTGLQVVYTWDGEDRVKITNVFVPYGSTRKVLPLSSAGVAEIINVLKTKPIFAGAVKDLEDYAAIHEDNTLYSEQVKLIKRIMERTLKQYQKQDLCRFYDGWLSFEVIFAMLEIRDHFIHNFETFLLGCYLMDAMKDVPQFSNSQEELLFQWILTSTFHDIGYPIEHYTKINEKLAALYEQFGINTIANKIKDQKLNPTTLEELYIINLPDNSVIYGGERRINLRPILLKELQDQLLLNEADANSLLLSLEDTFQHGLVSTCMLMKGILVNREVSYFSEESYKFLKNAALAVLLHHYPFKGCSVKLDIKLESTPMVALLMLCDEIQEWNRPLDDIGRDDYNARIPYQLKDLETIVQGSTLSINVKLLALGNFAPEAINTAAQKVLKLKEEKFSVIGPINQVGGRDIKLKLEIDQASYGPLEKYLVHS